MSIQPTQPQTVGGVLDTTFQLYKASIVKMIPLSLLGVIAGSPSSIYVFTRGGVGNPADPFAMLSMMRGSGYWLAALAVGTVLLIVPCLILMVSLALCFNTALFENKGPVDALTESHRLVWGNW